MSNAGYELGFHKGDMAYSLPLIMDELQQLEVEVISETLCDMRKAICEFFVAKGVELDADTGRSLFFGHGLQESEGGIFYINRNRLITRSSSFGIVAESFRFNDLDGENYKQSMFLAGGIDPSVEQEVDETTESSDFRTLTFMSVPIVTETANGPSLGFSNREYRADMSDHTEKAFFDYCSEQHQRPTLLDGVALINEVLTDFAEREPRAVDGTWLPGMRKLDE